MLSFDENPKPPAAMGATATIKVENDERSDTSSPIIRVCDSPGMGRNLFNQHFLSLFFKFYLNFFLSIYDRLHNSAIHLSIFLFIYL